MKIRYWMGCGLVALSGCAEVVSETSSTITVNGRDYELRTRVIDGQNGPFEQSSVIVDSRPYVCRPDSPGDCESAIRDARNSSSGRD